MKVSLCSRSCNRTVGSAVLALCAALRACGADDGDKSLATPEGPRTNKIGDDAGGLDPDGGKIGTDIVFPDGAAFEKRSCAVTLRWEGSASDVKIAGEFTGWETGALPLTKNGSAFEITLNPGPMLVGGKPYAYKIIADVRTNDD